MGQTLQMIAGADGGPWATTLLNDGQPVAFPSDSTFVATVSRGGGEASIFTPTVAWVDAASGTLSMSVSAAQIASLDPGSYVLQVFVATGGRKVPAFDGTLEILPSVGTETPGQTFCAFEDMLVFSSQVRSLQQSRGSDATGFYAQRAQVTGHLIRWFDKRYRPIQGLTKVRSGTPDPILGLEDVASPTAPFLPRAAFLAGMLGGGVVVDPRLREITARLAVALVLERQSTGTSSNVYMAEVEEQRRMAAEMLADYQVQLDTSDPLNGEPDYLIDTQCTILPTGTAP